MPESGIVRAVEQMDYLRPDPDRQAREDRQRAEALSEALAAGEAEYREAMRQLRKRPGQ